AAQAMVGEIRCAPPLVDYVQNLLTHSRRSASLAEGLSPRAGIALLRAARAWAMLDGRNHVLPDDVQAVLPAVAGHPLQPLMGGAPTHRGRAGRGSEPPKSVPAS